MTLNFWSSCSNSQVLSLQVWVTMPHLYIVPRIKSIYLYKLARLYQLICIPAFIILIFDIFSPPRTPINDVSVLIVTGKMIEWSFPWEYASSLNKLLISSHYHWGFTSWGWKCNHPEAFLRQPLNRLYFATIY